jgi:hypothetical protein
VQLGGAAEEPALAFDLALDAMAPAGERARFVREALDERTA